MHKNIVRALCLSLVFILALPAGQAWSGKDPRQWSENEIDRVLNDSPWAQPANAEFSRDLQDDATAPVPVPTPAQVGMPGPNGVSDGRWDGGVGRNRRGGVPTLPVLVRWDSALPVRQALARRQSAEKSSGGATVAFTRDQVRKDYIITVLGLVPARRQAPAESMEETLRGLMRTSRLIPRGHVPIQPDDAKLDLATGALHLFFPRSAAIALNQKEVTFVTRFGSLTVQKRFHLKDMVYGGALEL